MSRFYGFENDGIQYRLSAINKEECLSYLETACDMKMPVFLAFQSHGSEEHGVLECKVCRGCFGGLYFEVNGRFISVDELRWIQCYDVWHYQEVVYEELCY